MNILWLTWKDRRNPLAGGAEVVNEELAKRLASGGHKVTFLVAGFPGSQPQEDRDGFHIIRISSRYMVYLAAFSYFRRHQTELNPDLVIDECNTMPFFSAWYTHKPTIMFFHQLCRITWFYQFPQPLSTIGWLAEPVYLRLLKRSPVITISNSAKQDLIRHGFKAADIHIISEGSHLTPVKDPAGVVKFATPTIISLGSIRPVKRTLHQLQAFEHAKATMPDLRFIIGGDSSGSYGSQFLEAIKRSPYAADIDYRGHVSDAEKLELMQRAHAIVVTSVKEGWGLIVTEANSQGTPAVVYDVDGLRDSVRDGQTGLITPANTPEALGDKIIELLRDPARYQTLRTQAWQWSKTITFDQSYADFTKVLNLTTTPNESRQEVPTP